MKINRVEGPRRASRGVCLGVRELGDIERMKTINIFLLLDAVQHGVLVDVGGQGKLDQNTVDERI